MSRHKALFRYRDGRVDHGWFEGTLPLDPSVTRVGFSSDQEAAPRDVDLGDLKAIFLVRPWDGEPLPLPDASRVTIEFFDGEQIRGLASGWGPGRSSFLLIPEEQGRVEAIVVASASLSSVEVESS